MAEACALGEDNMTQFVDHTLRSSDRDLFDSSMTFLTCVFSNSLYSYLTRSLLSSVCFKVAKNPLFIIKLTTVNIFKCCCYFYANYEDGQL